MLLDDDISSRPTTVTATVAVEEKCPLQARNSDCRILFAGELGAFEETVAKALSSSGFQLSMLKRQTSVLVSSEDCPPDIVILVSGGFDPAIQEVIRTLRKRSDIGIIVIGPNEEPTDRILHLELGADDHICQTQGVREALARIKGLARRIECAGVTESKEYEFDGFRLMVSTRSLTSRDGVQVPITLREFDTLLLLLKNANRTVGRADIQGVGNAQVESRAADAIVGRLRRKLSANGGRQGLIRSVRSVGYTLSSPVSHK